MKEQPAPLLAEALLTETDPHVAGALTWALARAQPDVTETLTTGLNAKDPDVRRRAVQALTRLPTDETTPLLAAALDDPDATVRRHAAMALGARGRSDAIPVLVTMIVEGLNDVEAAETLGRLARHPDRAAAITTLLTDRSTAPDTDGPARLRLVQAFTEMPTATAIDALHRMADDPDTTVARTATALARALEQRTSDTPRDDTEP
ncbi:HEAT repeat domain-containing protein [Salininema proteolyticum]|uniref:HEAT repeat domain-containing protein n=1 Tax=Salininema proteolyticum TaxID=1607685 RepID=A0ABV8U524_9ACTN